MRVLEDELNVIVVDGYIRIHQILEIDAGNRCRDVAGVEVDSVQSPTGSDGGEIGFRRPVAPTTHTVEGELQLFSRRAALEMHLQRHHLVLEYGDEAGELEGAPRGVWHLETMLEAVIGRHRRRLQVVREGAIDDPKVGRGDPGVDRR